MSKVETDLELIRATGHPLTPAEVAEVTGDSASAVRNRWYHARKSGAILDLDGGAHGPPEWEGKTWHTVRVTPQELEVVQALRADDE